VTEYRLKRTIRDYLKAQNEGILIRQELNKDGTTMVLEQLAKEYISDKNNVKTIDKNKLIQAHIDVRLFGLMFPVEDIPFKKIGPIQFSIGQSLNKVKDILIRNTRIVPTRKEVKSGTFGEKTILKYSLILFHGFLNQFAAKELELTEADISKMMEAMWHGTNNLSTSSKFGQISRFLLRVIYADELAYIGELDTGIKLTNTEDSQINIEEISQAHIDVSKLLSMLNDNAEKIEEIQFSCHNNLTVAQTSGENNLKKLIEKWAESKNVKYKDLLAVKFNIREGTKKTKISR
jgi:CRISPR-associated protein Csh2